LVEIVVESSVSTVTVFEACVAEVGAEVGV